MGFFVPIVCASLGKASHFHEYSMFLKFDAEFQFYPVWVDIYLQATEVSYTGLLAPTDPILCIFVELK